MSNLKLLPTGEKFKPGDVVRIKPETFGAPGNVEANGMPYLITGWNPDNLRYDFIPLEGSPVPYILSGGLGEHFLVKDEFLTSAMRIHET